MFQFIKILAEVSEPPDLDYIESGTRISIFDPTTNSNFFVMALEEPLYLPDNDTYYFSYLILDHPWDGGVAYYNHANKCWERDIPEIQMLNNSLEQKLTKLSAKLVARELRSYVGKFGNKQEKRF